MTFISGMWFHTFSTTVFKTVVKNVLDRQTLIFTVAIFWQCLFPVVNFRNLYLDSFDNYYISRFVLGQYWKRLDSNMRKQFVKSFNDYIVTTYAPKFKGWSGKFKTIGSQVENNMYVVAMQLVTNSNSPTSLNLDWRMILKNNEFKILDVNIDGVSMLVTQRAEFSSVIKNHPLGVKGLIKQMNDKVNS